MCHDIWKQKVFICISMLNDAIVLKSHVLAQMANLVKCEHHSTEILCAGSNRLLRTVLCEQQRLWRVCTFKPVQSLVHCINASKMLPVFCYKIPQ